MAVNILVVDDSTTIQKVIRIAFSRYDVAIATAASYIEAISEIHAKTPDVILADASLNGVKSAADFQRLRREAEDAPLILLVGTYDSVNEQEFRAAGFSAIVKKPFESSDIIRIVSDAVGRDLEMEASTAATGGTTAPSAEARSHATTIMPPSPRDTHILPPPPAGGSASAMSDLAEKTIKLPEDEGPGDVPKTLARLPDLPATELHVSGEEAVLSEPGEGPMTTLQDLTIEPPMSAFDIEAIRDETPESAPDLAPIAVSAKKGLRAFDAEAPAPAPQADAGKRPGFMPPPPPVDDEDELADSPAFSLGNDAPAEAAPEPEEAPYAQPWPAHEATSPGTPSPAPFPPAGAPRTYNPSFGEVKAALDPLVRDEMAAMVRGAVEEYCARHFPGLVREIITAEIRRLTEEKSRLLVDG